VFEGEGEYGERRQTIGDRREERVSGKENEKKIKRCE
jgi:hypothetical protein